MNPPLNTALLAGLTLEVAAMFAMGFYWLVTRHRATHPRTPSPTLPPAASRPTPAAGDIDEWESGAPYPDHILKAVRELERELRGASSLSGTHPEAAQSDPSGDPRTELREAIQAIDALADKSSIPRPSAASSSTESSSPPVSRCPHCQSSRIGIRNRARKAGRIIGGAAGASGVMAAALAGAELGATLGIVAGPVGPVFGGLAGAVTAGIIGGTAGSLAGCAVGTVIDDKVLDNHMCLACGEAFSAARP